jgi:hypothetical protein
MATTIVSGDDVGTGSLWHGGPAETRGMGGCRFRWPFSLPRPNFPARQRKPSAGGRPLAARHPTAMTVAISSMLSPSTRHHLLAGMES